MKKKGVLLGILIISLIFSLYFIHFVSADTIPTQGLQDQANNIQQTANNLQQTPDEIRNQYLSQEWTKAVVDLPFIGPIIKPFHEFFLAHPLLFQILFNEPYAISLTFLLTLVLWIFIVISSYKVWKVYMREKWVAIVMSIGIAILVAQSTLIKIIVMAIIDLILGQQTWWIRAIMWLAFIGALFLLYYLDRVMAKKLRASRAAAEKSQMKQDVAETKAFVKGVKEGQKMRGKSNYTDNMSDLYK